MSAISSAAQHDQEVSRVRALKRDKRFDELDRLIEQEERKVLISGIIFSYKEKAPYVISGKSILGALELDKTQRGLKCHECGKLCWHLGVHVSKAHGVSPSHYKRVHGLRMNTRLVVPGLNDRKAPAAFMGKRNIAAMHSPESKAKAILSQSRKRMELANLKSRCAEQLKARVRDLSNSLGRAPTAIDLQRIGIYRQNLNEQLGTRSLRSSLEECGITFPGRKPGERVQVSTEQKKRTLAQLLREASESLGRVPVCTDCKRPILPSANVFVRVFGSWNNALWSAGLTQSANAGRLQTVSTAERSASIKS